MKNLLWLMLVMPWLTLFFVDKNTIKRYMPVTIFTAFLMTIIFQIAHAYHWWTIHQYIVPWGYIIDVSFAYGIFAVGTFWIFYFTSQKFGTYFLTNLAADALFSFAVFPLISRMGIVTLERIRYWQYFFVIVGLSLVIFVYHRWQEGIFQDREQREEESGDSDADIKRSFRRRAKANGS